MPKVKDKYYKSFLEGDLIHLIDREGIEKVIKNIKNFRVRGKPYDLTDQARALVFIAWATGARPCEIVDMVAGDVNKEGSYIKVRLRGAKGAFARVIYLPYRDPLVKEFYEYTKGMPPQMYLFWFFRSRYVRRRTETTITVRDPETGEKKKIKKVYTKPYPMKADRIRYYFRRWFSVLFEDGITPYYLRHNRFSSLATKGETLENIRMLKGAKTYDSCIVYTHMSKDMAKKISRKLIE